MILFLQRLGLRPAGDWRVPRTHVDDSGGLISHFLISGTMVRLVPMTQERFQAMTERVISHYAEEPVRRGTGRVRSGKPCTRHDRGVPPRGSRHARPGLSRDRGRGIGEACGRSLVYPAQPRAPPTALRRMSGSLSKRSTCRHGDDGGPPSTRGGSAPSRGLLGRKSVPAGDNSAALSLYGKLGFQPKNIFLAKNIPP